MLSLGDANFAGADICEYYGSFEQVKDLIFAEKEAEPFPAFMQFL